MIVGGETIRVLFLPGFISQLAILDLVLVNSLVNRTGFLKASSLMPSRIITDTFFSLSGVGATLERPWEDCAVSFLAPLESRF